jgi:7-cyano-7-deazaguanine reductase
MTTRPGKELENFANPRPGRDYEIAMECPEFTCVCPRTGQPDFAIIRIRYVPAELCVELKSLKLYLWSYRNEGAFHEAVINQILDDLVQAIRPKSMTVVGDFNVRGGIHTTVTASHDAAIRSEH